MGDSSYAGGLTHRPARTVALVLAILWIAWVTYEAYAGRGSSPFVFGSSIFAHVQFIVSDSSIGVIGLAVLAWLVETSGLVPPRIRPGSVVVDRTAGDR